MASSTDDLTYKLYTNANKRRAFYMTVSCGIELELDFLPKTGGGFQRLSSCCKAPSHIPMSFDLEKAGDTPTCTACGAPANFTSIYVMMKKEASLQSLLFPWLEAAGFSPLTTAVAAAMVEGFILDTYTILQTTLKTTGWEPYVQSEYVPIADILKKAFPSIQISSPGH